MIQDFLVVASNDVNKIALIDFENHCREIGYKTQKNVLSNKDYSNIIGVQLSQDSYNKDHSGNEHFISGVFLGILNNNFSDKRLANDEIMNLLDKQKDIDNFLPIEGSNCFVTICKSKIIFQNDIEGSRKLFYYIQNGLFCITTRLPLLLKILNNNWVIRKNAVVEYLTGRESNWPLTFIEGIKVLQPMSRGIVQEDSLHIRSSMYSNFYDLNKVSKQTTKNKLFKTYSNLIDKYDNEKVAVTLSGGFDSNCLTKLYAAKKDKDFTAVSVGYKAENFRGSNINNETVYAENISKFLKIPFKRYLFSKDEFFQEIDSLISLIDQPAHDPSSNHIMNRHLCKDGFKTVVNGMGGDANFSFQKSLYSMYWFVKLFGNNNISHFYKLSSLFNHEGPFKYFKKYNNTEKINSYQKVLEFSKIYGSFISPFISSKALKETFEGNQTRKNYFDTIFKSHKSVQELFYSYAILSNPDENHALITAERNNIEVVMPFINTPAVLAIMNSSKYNKIKNRSFQLDVFGGINKALLAKSKSGFSIPYSEWMPQIADETFNFFKDLDFFSNKSFDLDNFIENYNLNQEFSTSNQANKIVWKLYLLKQYMLKYNLQ
jgi:asparagine synthetase B (glutamine-hydrolysing)